MKNLWDNLKSFPKAIAEKLFEKDHSRFNQ